MKSKLVFILFICLYVNNLFSQEIKINAGATLSSFKSNGISFLGDNVTYPLITIGVDYLSHKYWYLSSEIGYVEKGGLEKQMAFMSEAQQLQKIDLEEHWPAFHLNTTLRIKIPAKNSNFLIGVGPALDIILGNRNPKNDLSGFKANRSSIGVKADVGYEININKGMKLGLVYSYIHTLTPFANYNGKHFYNRTSAFSILLGYKL